MLKQQKKNTMPMLGKKSFLLVKSLSDITSDEEIFTILHTQEKFRSKEEYEKRVELYSQRIWTCRCTGHTNLTHEEAWNSEKAAMKMIKSQFQEYFEKPVLQIVHHSTDSLDFLVDQAWTKLHHVLAVGETVTFKVNSCSKVLKGTVVSISSVNETSSTSSSCNSPSSDKENSSDDKDKSPKKWSAPKLLPYKYSVRLEDGLVINSVPVHDLTRSERPPSKELIRLFIRASALRAGQSSTSPWVVNDDLVKKYALPSKFADFLLSPSKMAEAAKRAEEVSKKRKRLSQDGVQKKKIKLATSIDKKIKKDKEKLKPVSLNKSVKNTSTKLCKVTDKKIVKANKLKKKEGTPKKKSSPDKTKKNPEVIEIDDSSDEDLSLAKIKVKCANQGDSDSDIPLACLTEQQLPKLKTKKSPEVKNSLFKKLPKKVSDIPANKKKPTDTKSPSKLKIKKTVDEKCPFKRKRQDSSDSDIPLSKLSSPKKTPGTPKSHNSTPVKKMKEKNEQTPQKKINKEKSENNKTGKVEDKSPSKQAPTKGMKQMTLLDMAKTKGLKSPSHTPKKSPAKPTTPLIVRKLMQLNKDEDRVKFGVLLKKAVMVLTPEQKKNLPSPLKEKVQKKMEIMEEKKKLEKMTEAQREEYFLEKKEKQKQKVKEKLKARMKELRKRYEDQDLTLHPLPQPKLVNTPENLPNELFGDIAMVTEFISSYSGLLMPDSEYPVYTDALMKALAGGAQGFAYLSRVLGILLQTLLQDEIAEDYSELNVPLGDIAVNPYTVSELVRLCLRKQDSDDTNSDAAETEHSEVGETLMQQLEVQEFYQLECLEKVALLKGLCLRLMGTYSVQDYMEEKQREVIQLTKQRNTEMKEFNEKMKDKRQKCGEERKNPVINGGDASHDNSPAMSISSFYGKKVDDISANDSAVDSQEEDGDNLVSIVKRRRLLAAKAAAEKEKKELERRLQREKEFQEEKSKREREQFETKFKDSITLARGVLRLTPIGYDRYHNRYWVFTNTTPGLYIEKGWIAQDISYNPGGLPIDTRDTNSMGAPTSTTASLEKAPNSPRRLNFKRKKALVESTIPHFGQNLWFTYTSVKDLDGVIKALHPQGIRESALKIELKKRYNDITKAIIVSQRNNLELRDSDGNAEMLAGFKKELADLELRLRNGGLGGVQDYSAWESRLMTASDIPILATCLLEVKEGILDKFLQGFMKVPQKLDQNDYEEEEQESGEEKVDTKLDKKLSAAEQRLQLWKDAAENCPTLSRLHVLLSMMDSCIKWEKSAENAKCKICRKKGDDDRLLLCDECNQAFHMYCLRPALICVPRGDWFCPACVPQSKRRIQVPLRYADESESEEESEEEEEVQEHNTACEECGADDDELVSCSSCPAVYHLDCHHPPLRRTPRGTWECNNCKNGITKLNKKRPQRKAASRKNYRYDDSAEDSEPHQPTRSSSSRRTKHTLIPDGSSPRSPRTRYGDGHEDISHHRSRRAPSDLSICEDILQRLMKHNSSWPFLEPVDKKEVPDYHHIIKKPMDFQTMLKKCGRLSYSSPQEFVEDAILVFSNAATYNEPNSDVYQCMREVEKFFTELLTKYLPDYTRTQRSAANSGDNVFTNARLRRSRRN